MTPELEFMRPCGVPGEQPRASLRVVSAAPKPRDLSLEATPASEDLRNALCIIAPIDDSLLKEALERLITNALRKIEPPRAGVA